MKEADLQKEKSEKQDLEARLVEKDMQYSKLYEIASSVCCLRHHSLWDENASLARKLQVSTAVRMLVLYCS